VGTHCPDPKDDYPDYAEAVAEADCERQAERGVLICAAALERLLPPTRFLGYGQDFARIPIPPSGVEHDDMNVLVIGARVIGTALARELVHAYLNATFTGEERHRRRLEKVKALEAKYAGTTKVRSQPAQRSEAHR